MPCPIDPHEEAPYVCPGCQAVAEPCAPGCIDAEIAREREVSYDLESSYADLDELEDPR